MTSSQEPQLTRREVRERERLREQQVPSTTPDAPPAAYPAHQPAPPAPVAPVQPMAPAAQPFPAPAPMPGGTPAYAAPQQVGAYGAQPSPFGGAAAMPSQQNPYAPSPVPPMAMPPTGAPAPHLAPVPQQAQAPYPAPAPYPAAPPSHQPPAPERTLTRRELRAMLDASQLGDLDLDDEFDDVDDPAAAYQQAPAAPTSPAPIAGQPPAGPQYGQAYPPQQQVPAQQHAPVQQQHAPVQRQQAPAQQQQAPIQRQQAPSQQQQQAPVQQYAPAPVGAIGETSPVGHWASQLHAPDRAEPFDQLLSRGGVSHGVPTTTNALILPALPDHGQIGNPLASAGEIIATGTIDLPRSYGATGVHPSQIDSSDVDRLFDRVEDVGTGVAPVAATSAISTQGASRTMIAPPKKEGMNVPLVLAVTAGVLALGVVATLVIGTVFSLF